MHVAPEIVQELHVECVRALRWYIAEANKTCRILAEITRFPVSLVGQILNSRKKTRTMWSALPFDWRRTRQCIRLLSGYSSG